MGDQEEYDLNVAMILGVELDTDEESPCIPEELEVNERNIQIYCEYLQKNLGMPCYLTGIEDFAWEEKYVFFGGNKNEYERMKKRKASYTDVFKLIELYVNPNESVIFARVKRISDSKKFTLPLDELESTDSKTSNYKILADYSSWAVNYR